jgi:hypothetical protein
VASWFSWATMTPVRTENIARMQVFIFYSRSRVDWLNALDVAGNTLMSRRIAPIDRNWKFMNFDIRSNNFPWSSSRSAPPPWIGSSERKVNESY